MLIKRQSPLSGQIHEMDIDVTEEQLTAWKAGTLIQNVMPTLTPDEREFIMTGITAAEWEDTFGASV